MKVFDASSIIYAWDNYPISHIPGLWDWLAVQVESKELTIPRPAFREVQDVSPDCGAWLRENGISRLAINNAIAQDALRMKNLLGIVEDRYHPNGVDENDLLIIATAAEHGVTVVSNEGRQRDIPRNLAKCKIPAVCAMDEVNVDCINFLEYFTQYDLILDLR